MSRLLFYTIRIITGMGGTLGEGVLEIRDAYSRKKSLTSGHTKQWQVGHC